MKFASSFRRVVRQSDRPWRERVDAHFRREFFRQATRQHDDAGFRDRMWDVAGPAKDAPDIGKIDDAAAAFLQQRRCRLRAEKRRFEIRVKRLTPLFFRGIGEFGFHKTRSAVHQNIEPAELRSHVLKQRANLRDIVKIGLQSDRTPPKFFDFGDDFARIVRRRSIVNDNIRAAFRKAERDFASEPLARAGHQTPLD